MNEVIQHIHWVNHGVALGYLIAFYLFFFALAEGTHIVAHVSWLYHRKDNFRPIEKVGSFLPFVILSFVSFFLIIDLGHPERALSMIYNWNWTAPVAYGFYIILLCVITYAFHAFYLFRPEMTVRIRENGTYARLYRLLIRGDLQKGSVKEIQDRHSSKERFWAIASVTLSFIGLIYLGFFLSSFKGRVAWHSEMMIFIFISQGLTTGTAFLILFTNIKNLIAPPSPGALSEQGDYISGLAVFLRYALLVHILVWSLYFLQLMFTGEGGQTMAKMLLKGPRASQFWIFQIGIGIILPLLILFIRQTLERTGMIIIAALGILIGGFYSIINLFIGGQLLPMTGPVWEKIQPDPNKMIFAGIMTAIILGIFLISYKLLPYENIEKEGA